MFSKLSKSLINLTGQTFGYWEVVQYAGSYGGATYRRAYWWCLCICGRAKMVSGTSLRKGHSKSCGCKTAELAGAHFLSETCEYGTWSQMKKRCYNPKAINYQDYGGRGIRVCDRWKNSFLAFLDDMGWRPTIKHTIDRINNDGDYSPENCRWTTTAQQNRNQRRTRRITFQGQSFAAYEFGRYLGVHGGTIIKWLDKGMSPEEMFHRAENLN